MNEKKTGGPAFPVYHGGYSRSDNDGLTLRDYFAAKAMQAMLSSPNCPIMIEESELAKQAHMVADAMLKAREE